MTDLKFENILNETDFDYHDDELQYTTITKAEAIIEGEYEFPWLLKRKLGYKKGNRAGYDGEISGQIDYRDSKLHLWTIIPKKSQDIKKIDIIAKKIGAKRRR